MIAKKILNKFSHFPEITVDSDRFLRFLLETGIMGKVESSDERQLYNSFGNQINTEFEYTLSRKLDFNSVDKLAVHPIFIAKLGCGNIQDIGKYMGVYPKGCDMAFD